MDSQLAHIVETERAGILAEIALTNVLPLIAVNDITILRNVPSIARWNAPATLHALDAGDPAKGWVLDCPRLQYKSFWALTTDDKYRDHYKEFLWNEHRYDGLVPGDLDVDHLFNRARGSIYNFTYIRMFLVPSSPNSSHGGGYEASITSSEPNRDVGDRKIMDEVVFMKFMGVKSPRFGRPLTLAQQQHLQSVAASTGIAYLELLANVQGLMQKANSGWAADT
jgi:hypothetical protein